MTTASVTEQEKLSQSPPAEGEASESEGCPNCGSQEPWGTASWCPDCGFYPALGGTSLRSAEEVQGGSHQAAWESLHDGPSTLMEAIPPWAWTAMGGVVLILLANIGARVILPLEPAHRTLLTLVEFSLGTLVAGIAQGSAYLFAACRSDKYAPFDFFMKPIEIWKPTFHKLPEGCRRVWGVAWGGTAVFCSLTVVGGFDFDALFDWGIEKYEKPNVVQEVVQQARENGEGEEDLEGALNEFVGEAEEASATKLETRCTIIGYTTSDQGELSTLILAAAPRGPLAYVGVLSETDLPEENRAELLRALKSAGKRSTCFIERGVPFRTANWVEPNVLCLIEHQSWTSHFHLQQPSFVKLVSEEEEKESAGENALNR